MRNSEDEITKEETDCMWDRSIFSIVLWIITLCLILNAFKSHTVTPFIYAAIALIFYYWDVYSSNTLRFLSHIYTLEEAKELLKKLCESPPLIYWKVNSYHSGHQLSSSPIVTFSVKTKKASNDESFYNVANINDTLDSIKIRGQSTVDIQSVKYNFWRDSSNAQIYIDNLEKLIPCRFYLIKRLYFEDDESLQRYQSDMEFSKGKKVKDTIVALIECLKIRGYKGKFIVVKKRSIMLSKLSYILASLIGLSWVVRLYVYAAMKKSCVSINKIISY